MILAGVVPTLIAASVLHIWPERFTATALVIVNQELPQMVDPDWDRLDGNSQNRLVASQVDMVRSDAVLRRAVQSASPSLVAALLSARQWRWPNLNANAQDGPVRQRDGSVRFRDDDETMVSLLRDSVRFTRQQTSAVIAIEVTSQGAHAAAGWANALADAFLAEQAAHKVEMARQAHDVLTDQAGHLAQRIQGLEGRLDGLPGVVTGVGSTRSQERQLTSELEAARSLYRQTYEQLQRVALTMDTQVADGSLISRAFPPAEPSHPPRTLVLALVAFGGLAAGVASAIKAEARAPEIVDRDALEELGLPVAAAIPFLAADQGLMQDHAFVARAGPVGDALRTLVATLEASGPDDGGGHCLLVTSPDRGAGKTSVALAVALHAARGGRRVLLIDAVLKAPKVLNMLGFVAQPTDGQLSDLLSGRVGPDQVLGLARREAMTGLDVLANSEPAGDRSDHMLRASTFAGLVEGARTAYDLVLIDSPATYIAPDAELMSRHATMIALCVRPQSSRRDQIQAALDGLTEQVHAPRLLGHRSPPPVIGLLNAVPKGWENRRD